MWMPVSVSQLVLMMCVYHVQCILGTGPAIQGPALHRPFSWLGMSALQWSVNTDLTTPLLKKLLTNTDRPPQVCPAGPQAASWKRDLSPALRPKDRDKETTRTEGNSAYATVT